MPRLQPMRADHPPATHPAPKWSNARLESSPRQNKFLATLQRGLQTRRSAALPKQYNKKVIGTA